MPPKSKTVKKGKKKGTRRARKKITSGGSYSGQVRGMGGGGGGGGMPYFIHKEIYLPAKEPIVPLHNSYRQRGESNVPDYMRVGLDTARRLTDTKLGRRMTDYYLDKWMYPSMDAIPGGDRVRTFRDYGSDGLDGIVDRFSNMTISDGNDGPENVTDMQISGGNEDVMPTSEQPQVPAQSNNTVPVPDHYSETGFAFDSAYRDYINQNQRRQDPSPDQMGVQVPGNHIDTPTTPTLKPFDTPRSDDDPYGALSDAMATRKKKGTLKPPDTPRSDDDPYGALGDAMAQPSAPEDVITRAPSPSFERYIPTDGYIPAPYIPASPRKPKDLSPPPSLPQVPAQHIGEQRRPPKLVGKRGITENDIPLVDPLDVTGDIVSSSSKRQKTNNAYVWPGESRDMPDAHIPAHILTGTDEFHGNLLHEEGDVYAAHELTGTREFHGSLLEDEGDIYAAHELTGKGDISETDMTGDKRKMQKTHHVYQAAREPKSSIKKRGVVLNDETGRVHKLSQSDIGTLNAQGEGTYAYKMPVTGRMRNFSYSSQDIYNKHLSVSTKDAKTAASVAEALTGNGHVIKYPGRTVRLEEPIHHRQRHPKDKIFEDMAMESIGQRLDIDTLSHIGLFL